MFYPVKIICYFAIASSVGFQFSACISLTQDEYNIITNKPLRLLCDVEIPITTQVTIRSPDNVAVVTCTGAVLSPPAPAGCTSAAGYTGSINETAYTVTVTTNNLPANVNGTWKCTHNSIDATIIFPNPVPCFTTESFTQSSFTGNQTIDTAAISLTATYSCINVDVTFRWILTASTSHEVSSTSTSVSKDSSTCTDSGTCTGVNAYTQIISSDSIFGFATTNGLQGLYVLSVEAHYTNGITALQSQSIGNFIFSVYASTPIPTTKPLPDKECVFDMSYLLCAFAFGTPALVVICIIIIYIIYKIIQYCRKMSETKRQNHVVDLSEIQSKEDSKTYKNFQDKKKGEERTQRLSTQKAGQSKLGATKETTE